MEEEKLYVLLDTNIWIYLLEINSSNENFITNFFEYVRQDYIKLLLPEIILTEWDRHKEEKKKELRKNWNNFFVMAEKIIDRGVLSQYKKPGIISQNIDSRFEQIEDIINNFSIKLEITDSIKIKSTKLAEEHKAPFHGKTNSICDAFIYLAFVDYIKSNEILEAYFISSNTSDFSKETKRENKKIIHPDLAEPFTEYKVKYFIDHNEALYRIDDHFKKRNIVLTQASDRRVVSFISSEAEEEIADLPDIYLENIAHLDLIIKKDTPTKQETIFAFTLIESSDHYKNYFLNRIDSYSWLELLKKRGYLEPNKNPDLIETEKGFQTPFWTILSYLEKISRKAKDENDLDIFEALLEFVLSIFQNPKDNYHTWTSLIRIISDLPNEKVPKELLRKIEICFSGKFDPLTQSSDFMDRLLPKFLKNVSTVDDVEKAGILIDLMLSLKKRDFVESENTFITPKYYVSYIDLYYLNEFLKSDLFCLVARLDIEEIIVNACLNIKKILLNYDIEKDIIFNSEDSNIKITYTEDDLKLFFIKEDRQIIIERYNSLKEEEIRQVLCRELEEELLTFELDSLVDLIFDENSWIWLNSMFDRTDDSYIERDSKEFITMSILKIIDLAILDRSEIVIQIIEKLFTEPQFNYPYFKNIGFYVIGKYWVEHFNTVFWYVIGEGDPQNYFTKDAYRHVIYNVISKNNNILSTVDKERINKIISQGPKSILKDFPEDYTERWEKFWKSSLDIKPDTDDENSSILGGFRTIGEISPYAIEDLLVLSNMEIVQRVIDFKQESHFEGPSTSGLMKTLETLSSNYPEKMSKDMNVFYNLPYLYFYGILSGLRKAWEEKKMINWNNVFSFINQYLSSERLRSNEFIIEGDLWNCDNNWIIGAIAELIQSGTAKDDNSIPLENVNDAVTILRNLISYIPKDQEIDPNYRDWPSYSLNSTAGKVIHAMVNTALFIGRNQLKDHDIKWEDNTKTLFDIVRTKGVVDFYIITGQYINQFYYLDKVWILDLLKDYEQIDDKYWWPFIKGLSYTNVRKIQELFLGIKPHIRKYVELRFDSETNITKRIPESIILYYLWGFIDFENEMIMNPFLETINSVEVNDISHWLTNQKDSIRNISDEEERESIYSKIFKLWNYLIEKKIANTQSNLLAYICFVEEFTPFHFDLIIRSIDELSIFNYQTRTFFNELNRLKEIGNKNQNADYIGQIFEKLISGESDGFMYNEINELIEFLYLNNQKGIADKVSNECAKVGNFKLRELYDKYNRQ